MMAGDPFPLFHLSDLSFALDSLLSLSSAQLALASYSSEWDPDANLDKKVSRLFRQRREKIRGRLGTPIGVFASQEDRAATQWPLFELSDLSWELDGANLDHLTSAQLALIPFHPDSTKDLVEKAEDLFWARRERDFGGGLSLPPLPPPPPPQAVAEAPRDVPPLPSSSRSRSRLPPPAVASTSSARGATASNAQSWLDEDVEMAAPPPPAPVLKESILLGEYRRREEERKTRDDDDARAAAKQAEDDVQPREDEVRRRQEEEAREAHRKKEDEIRKEAKRKDDDLKQQDELRRQDELKRQGELKRQDDLKRQERAQQDAKRKEDDERDARRKKEAARLAEDERVHHERGYQLERQDSSSSKKDRQRERERLEQDLDLMNHDRKREREVGDDEGRDRRRRRSSVGPPRDEPDHDAPRPGSREGVWSRRSSRDCRAGSATPTAPSRRIYAKIADAESALPRDYEKPFVPEDDVPDELRNCFHVVFIGGIPSSTSVEIIRSMLLDAYDVAPVAIKVSMVGPVAHVFVAFLVREDAKAVISRIDGQIFKGRTIQASFSTTPASASHATWRWITCDREFQQEWRAGRIRLPLPRRDPLPTHYHSTVAPRAPPEDNALVPRDVILELYQLFVSNLPENVNVDDLRKYFDHFNGIVGISIGTPNRGFRNNSCWLAFSTKDQRNDCMRQIQNKTFPRASQSMYLERGEPKKLAHEWRWLDMMKFFRIQHRDTSSSKFAPPSHSSPPQLQSHQPLSPQRRRRSATPEPRRPSTREFDHSPELRRSSNRERSPELRRISSNNGSTSSAPPPPPAQTSPHRNDEGYAPSNPGVPGLVPLYPPLSPALSGAGLTSRPKVHPSRLQLVPDVPIVADPAAAAVLINSRSEDVLKDALAALLPLSTPSKPQPPTTPTVGRSSPASLGSNANWGVRVPRPSAASLNGGAPSDTIGNGRATTTSQIGYERQSHRHISPSTLDHRTKMDEDEDHFQPRDWTTWRPAQPQAPAPVLAPTPPPRAIARTGTTPTGPKRLLSIKGASGSPPLGATGVLGGNGGKEGEGEGGVKAHEAFLKTLFSSARGAGKMINGAGEGQEAKGEGEGLGLGLRLGLAARIGGIEDVGMEVDEDAPEGK